VCAPLKGRRKERQLPNATDLIAHLARAIGFLSRLPVPDRFFRGHDGSMSRMVAAFPIAGFVIALVPALLLYVLARTGDTLVATLLALSLLTLLTGALHEDGLADAADGLGGGRDKEHALLIMKDSRIGSYGVVALILSFGLRAAALAAIARLDPALAALALLASSALSRGAMVWHWHALGPARASGVAASAGRPNDRALAIALGTGVIAGLILVTPHASLRASVTALAMAGCATLVFTRIVRRKVGGHTGDTIGATQQITEIVMLATLALAA
jgi:adenosylcobinamide-GDP ribazoletransferase